jgi:hypothetical protein
MGSRKARGIQEGDTAGKRLAAKNVLFLKRKRPDAFERK